MADKKCPNCGLWSAESAWRCDCGYDFRSEQTKPSDIKTVNNQEKHQKNISAMMAYLFEQFNLGKTDKQLVSDLVSKGIKQNDAKFLIETAEKLYESPQASNNLVRYAAAQRGWKRM